MEDEGLEGYPYGLTSKAPQEAIDSYNEHKEIWTDPEKRDKFFKDNRKQALQELGEAQKRGDIPEGEPLRNPGHKKGRLRGANFGPRRAAANEKYTHFLKINHPTSCLS